MRNNNDKNSNNNNNPRVSDAFRKLGYHCTRKRQRPRENRVSNGTRAAQREEGNAHPCHRRQSSEQTVPCGVLRQLFSLLYYIHDSKHRFRFLSTQ